MTLMVKAIFFGESRAIFMQNSLLTSQDLFLMYRLIRLQEALAPQSHLDRHSIFPLTNTKLTSGHFRQMSYVHLMEISGMLYTRVMTIFSDIHRIVPLHTIQLREQSGFRYLQLIRMTN